MNAPASDNSRDRRIEDLTNLWVVHPAGRILLPWALRRGLSANAVSFFGLGFGTFAAVCYFGWSDWRLASLGFLLTIAWLIADGLDGMVARASGTASALGRILDGMCDHGVFGLLYLAIAFSLGGTDSFLLGVAAALCHAVQSSLYEGERERYHRRLRGDPSPPPPLPSRNPLVRSHEAVARSLEWVAADFDRRLMQSPDRARTIERYRALAAAPMKLQSLLSANVRVIVLYAACLAGNPALFWWFEIIPLSTVALLGILWHRRAERLSMPPGGA